MIFSNNSCTTALLAKITLILMTLSLFHGATYAQSVQIPNFWDPNIRLQPHQNFKVNRLRFLTTTDFAPFNFIDDKKRLTGFHIDLAREICRTLKILELCQIQAVRWEELAEKIDKGEGEAIIAGIDNNAKNRQRYLFTHTFLQLPARFVALRKKSDSKNGIGTTGLIQGSAHEAYFKDMFEEEKFKTFPDLKAAVQALRQGAVDRIFADAVSLAFWLTSKQSQDCCQFSSGPYLSQEYFGRGLSIAVPKDQRELNAALDYALAKIYEKGIYRELYLRYFPLSLF